ncbi:uncharacterized protein Ecym_2537 [Eremothecium cymbalariae DBVPG|uniref:Uncharacterized protein n=1 Tax=Eremothecium cymbalariae (strain CBS 270.75 / DBVPG 7215 / KCTC 17166 / NRRL Y-17582) TaxID=931890 RepID=G8JQ99_ERECY|nr:Hypothetical protein Ecym_2537 [Eremothecium cymbalariae DBVPG\
MLVGEDITGLSSLKTTKYVVQVDNAGVPEKRPQYVKDLKRIHKHEKELIILYDFMIIKLTVGLVRKYMHLLFPIKCKGILSSNICCHHRVPLKLNEDGLTYFIKVLICRSKMTRNQLKHMYVLTIKFLSLCDVTGVNYMHCLHHDINKLLVACLVLTHGNDWHRKPPICKRYSKVTGLHEDQIILCCNIVAPILESECLRQRRLMIDQRQQQQDLSNKANIAASFQRYPPPDTIYNHSLPEDKYLLPEELDQFNVFGKLLVKRHFNIR